MLLSIYRPPKAPKDSLLDFSAATTFTLSRYEHVLIAGDFNCHNQDWGIPEPARWAALLQISYSRLPISCSMMAAPLGEIRFWTSPLPRPLLCLQSRAGGLEPPLCPTTKPSFSQSHQLSLLHQIQRPSRAGISAPLRLHGSSFNSLQSSGCATTLSTLQPGMQLT